MSESVEEMVNQYRLASENLTEKQLAEAFRQALVSGDFIQQVRMTDGARQVVYIPFNMVSDLQFQIEQLTTACKMALMFHAENYWTDDQKNDWRASLHSLLGPPESRTEVGADEATSRNLCRAIRAALGRSQE